MFVGVVIQVKLTPDVHAVCIDDMKFIGIVQPCTYAVMRVSFVSLCEWCSAVDFFF